MRNNYTYYFCPYLQCNNFSKVFICIFYDSVSSKGVVQNGH